MDQRYGNLTISATQIVRTGLFGRRRTVDRAAVRALVKATVKDPSRYGASTTAQVVLVGPDSRCLLVASGECDVDGLASDLGVPLERINDPIWRRDLNRKYPGVTPPERVFVLWLALGVMVSAAALLLWVAAARGH